MEADQDSADSGKDKRITVDPRMFIYAPYVECPSCGKPDFGVLMVSGNGYARRCRSCWHDQHYPLPALQKKLIYLDQPAISNMTKVLDPKSAGHERAIRDDYWLELYKRLDRLAKLQLIVCPDSHFHRDESVVGKDYESMRRLYEHLSGGATFYDHDTITRFEIAGHFEDWLDGTSGYNKPLKAEQVIHGKLNEWQDHFNVSVDMGIREGEIEGLRASRDGGFSALQAVFERWRTETERSLEDWMKEEAAAFGKVHWESYVRHVIRMREVTEGKRKMEPEDLLGPPGGPLIQGMLRELERRGLDFETQLKKMGEYFRSTSILEVPAIRISSLLFASLARMAAHGQRRPPSRGAVTDINAISSILPYVDAMFVDDENARFLTTPPGKDHVGFPARIFSNQSRQEFLDYLESIEANAAPEHLAAVREVYGDDWGSPYLSVLADARKRREAEPPKRKGPSIGETMRRVNEEMAHEEMEAEEPGKDDSSDGRS